MRLGYPCLQPWWLVFIWKLEAKRRKNNYPVEQGIVFKGLCPERKEKMKRSAGQILGQNSKGEPKDARACQQCDNCGRRYKKNWMQVYWKTKPTGKAEHDLKNRGYLCPYCNMDREGLSLREGIRDVHMMMWNSLGQDPKQVLRGYIPFGGSVPSGQVDIDRVSDEALEKIMDLQIQNQQLVKRLAQAGIPSHEEHIQECIEMIDELNVPFKDKIIKRLKKGLEKTSGAMP